MASGWPRWIACEPGWSSSRSAIRRLKRVIGEEVHADASEASEVAQPPPGVSP